MALSVFGTQTFTISGQPAAAATLVVGGTTYTWRATVGATANEILIGATTGATIQNAFDAINATPAALGVTVGSATVRNPEARSKSVTATVLTVRANVPGVIGNRVPTTSSTANITAGGATLASGAGDLAADLQGNLLTMQMPASVAEVLDKVVFGNEVAPS